MKITCFLSALQVHRLYKVRKDIIEIALVVFLQLAHMNSTIGIPDQDFQKKWSDIEQVNDPMIHALLFINM